MFPWNQVFLHKTNININVFQDSLLCSKAREKERGGEHQADVRFLSRIVRKQTPDRQEDPAEFLLNMAQLRICLSSAAKLLKRATLQRELPTGGQVEGAEYLRQVRGVCEYGDNDWLRVYLVRALYRCSSMDSILTLMNNPTWRWIFPAELLKLQVKISV